MKKLILLFLCLTMSLAFFACLDDSDGEPDVPGSTSEAPDADAESPEKPAQDTFNVTWYAPDGTLIVREELKSGTVPSRTYTVTDTAEWDYTFEGWSATKDGEVLSTLPSVSADVSYYAKVSKVKRTYTVSFEVGNATAVPSQTVEYGAFAKEPTAPKLEGYRFVGWYSDAECKTGADFGKPITGNTKFYASFELVPVVRDTFNVTWYAPDGTLIAKEELKSGTVPSRTYAVTDTAEWDYTFEGWSATKDGEVLSTLPSVSADVSYYAKVSKVKRTYTVSFEVGDATAVPSQTVEYGAFAKEPTAPKLEGYRFVGWYSDAECKTGADFGKPITGDTKFYASFNKKIDIAPMLANLLSGYKMNPYSKIPKSMRPDYSSHIIDADGDISDYSKFVSVSDIKTHGFGQQWNMIIENINQSTVFFNALTAVDGLVTVSIAEFNNYLDKNASDTAHYSFASGIYNVTIDFDGSVIYYVLDYTATLGSLGEQSVQISMCMDINTSVKTVRVQIGDANALKYTLSDGVYEFAIKYLGVRRAYFLLKEDSDGSVAGHIYEYISYEGNELKSSAADFYITTDGYLTAVGNKADGLKGFDGYISETYDLSDGSLVGYEVREELSSIIYNTLWFDLGNIAGLNSIKVIEGDGDDAGVYINGSKVKFEVKKVGGFSVKALSRRYDIEMRARYFYTYDEESGEYVKREVYVPMLRVQEENYSTLSKDIEEENGITLTPTVSDANLERIKSDYAAYVDVFILNKDSVSSEKIVEYIGGKTVFDKKED